MRRVHLPPHTLDTVGKSPRDGKRQKPHQPHTQSPIGMYPMALENSLHTSPKNPSTYSPPPAIYTSSPQKREQKSNYRRKPREKEKEREAGKKKRAGKMCHRGLANGMSICERERVSFQTHTQGTLEKRCSPITPIRTSNGGKQSMSC